MLVLSRKKNETIHIGPYVTVTVLEGSRVKLGVEAPDDVRITRDKPPEETDSAAGAA